MKYISRTTTGINYFGSSDTFPTLDTCTHHRKLPLKVNWPHARTWFPSMFSFSSSEQMRLFLLEASFIFNDSNAMVIYFSKWTVVAITSSLLFLIDFSRKWQFSAANFAWSCTEMLVSLRLRNYPTTRTEPLIWCRYNSATSLGLLQFSSTRPNILKKS